MCPRVGKHCEGYVPELRSRGRVQRSFADTGTDGQGSGFGVVGDDLRFVGISEIASADPFKLRRNGRDKRRGGALLRGLHPCQRLPLFDLLRRGVATQVRFDAAWHDRVGKDPIPRPATGGIHGKQRIR